MKTKVIIPAYNEAHTIRRTLDSLPADLTEPIVAVNGEDDGTLAIAEQLGAEVLLSEEQGKTRAIQQALGYIGSSAALEPILLLDADTQPIFARRWHEGMVDRLLSDDRPTSIGGPVIFTGKPAHEAVLRSVYRVYRTARHSQVDDTVHSVQFGPNMALKLHDSQTLDAIMELPNYWPSEDRAIAQTIIDQGGAHQTPIHPSLATITPTSLSAVSLRERIRYGSEGSVKLAEQRYIERSAPNTLAFRPHSEQ